MAKRKGDWITAMLTRFNGGITNQGTNKASFRDGDSRQQRRRLAFTFKYRALTEKYGLTMSRRIRRKIAWDSLKYTRP